MYSALGMAAYQLSLPDPAEAGALCTGHRVRLMAQPSISVKGNRPYKCYRLLVVRKV